MATQLVSTPTKIDLLDLDRALFKKPRSETEAWLYYLSVSACFAVVWGHVAAGLIINSPTNSFPWLAGIIGDSLPRWCMPIFIMVSGYLNLSPIRHYSVTTFYKKRAGKILIPLIFWALAYSSLTAVRHASNDLPVTLKSFFIPILTGHPYYHLWYLYMIAGLFLLTPLLKMAINRLRERSLVILCVSLFVVPIIANVFCWFVLKTDFNNSYPFVVWPLFYLGYFLAGYIIGKKATIEINTKVLITLVVASLAVTAVGCYLLSRYYSFFMGQYFHSALSPNGVVTGLAVFMLVKKVVKTGQRNKYLEKCRPLTYGVYLLHPFWLFFASYLGLDVTRINPLIGVPVISATVFFLSLFSSFVIQKIPYVNRVA
jgi:surface polysaccharide O-acyltransferase-like enzyme